MNSPPSVRPHELPVEEALDTASVNNRSMNASDDSTVSDTSHKLIPGRRLFQRLGWYAIVSIPLCLVTTLAALAFLWFLWLAHSDNSTWQRIMLDAWATRSITIASLFLRTSAAIQAGICTSMMAAVALEHGMFVLSKAAAVSSIRFVNSGPSDLLLLFWGRIGVGKIPMVFFVLAITITTMLSQFTSTLLLSDLKLSMIPGTTENQNISYTKLGSTDNQYASDTQLWTSRPQYPIFAEYPGVSTTENGISDTGMTMRALIPLASTESRSLLRNYSGPATVFDSRVVCVRPTVNATLGIIDSTLSKRTTGLGFNIAGHINATKWPSRLLNITSSNLDGTGTRGQFKCDMDLPAVNNSNQEWALTLCGVDPREILMSPLTGPATSKQVSSFPGVNLGFVIINATGDHANWSQAVEGRSEQPTGSIWKIHPRSDEWVDLVQPDYNVNVSLSLCYADYNFFDVQIHASTPGNLTEYSVLPDKSGQYNSTDVRYHLGAVIPNTTPENRGIMLLESMPWEKLLDQNLRSYNYTNFLMSDFMTDRLQYGSGKSLCNGCFVGDAERVNRVMESVFQQTCRDGGNAALALQAQLTTILQMAYYNNIDEFNAVAPAQLQSFVQVLSPRSLTGLIVVTCVLCVHFILIFAAIGQFLYRTQYSMLGNAWQTVMQLCAPDTEPIFAMPSVISDSEVEKLSASNAGIEKSVVLRRLRDSDRVGIENV
jgi:hypothetical protein